jgi:hypothetical protein
MGAAIVVQKKWSILILTQPSRARFLARLLNVLAPQVQGRAEVEIVIRTHDLAVGGYGDNAELLRQAARGEYQNFVDDDDLVSGTYVERILPLLHGVDYVGFKFRWTCDGESLKPWYHSLKFQGLCADASGVYRDISHLNPMRRELALRVPFSRGLDADSRWAQEMRAMGVVKSEHFVDEFIYHYDQISQRRRKEYFATAVPPELPPF